MDIKTYLKDFSFHRSPVLAMGIVNITPDSFHDGGKYFQPQQAFTHIKQLIDEGADIIDLGAASSRPGFTIVSEEEEIARLLPVLKLCAAQNHSWTLSVDTDNPTVAQAALMNGVSIINDCSGLLNTKMFSLAAESSAPLIVMHRAGEEGQHTDVVQEVIDFFQAAEQSAAASGMQPWQLIFDPGLGFNKSIEENNDLIQALPRLADLGRPLLIGYSHKRFAAALSDEKPGNAPRANKLLASYCVRHGANIVRVHEVAEFWNAVQNEVTR